VVDRLRDSTKKTLDEDGADGWSVNEKNWLVLALSWGYVMEIYHGSSTQSRRIRGKMW